VKDSSGVDDLVAPRRDVLDMIRLDAARGSGATTRTGVSVTNTLTDAAGRVTDVRAPAAAPAVAS
jgi:hypothetical protein